MFENLVNDKLLGALKPQIEKAIEPMFHEARAALFSKIVGPPPPSFKESLDRMYTLTPIEIKRIWEAACESVL